jgi:hypothetical protein
MAEKNGCFANDDYDDDVMYYNPEARYALASNRHESPRSWISKCTT